MRYKFFLSTFALTALLVCTSSCSDSVSGLDEVVNHTQQRVGVTTRIATELSYPLKLYAFYAESGRLAQYTIADNANDRLEFALAVGRYRLVAMAGTQGLEEVPTPTLDKSIGVPDGGIIASAVQMGSADVIIADADVNVNLQMSYQVAQVNIELQDIPTDVEGVTVTLSSLYADATFGGSLDGEHAVVVPLSCQEDGTTWSSGVVYTLPGSSVQLTLSISMTDAEGTSVYGYTHTSNLEAGKPYALVGSFKEGFDLTGTITAEEWGMPETITFKFGDGAGNPEDGGAGDVDDGEDGGSDNGSGEGVESGEIYSVESIPASRALWNGHFVAKVSSNDTNSEAELLLFSLNEWEVTRDGIISVVDGYAEADITDWRLATEEEMKNLAIYLGHSSNINSVNSVITSVSGSRLTASKGYFCADGSRYAMMGTEQSGNTVDSSKYKLRLVKTVTVKVL